MKKKVNELFLNISNLMNSNSEDLKVIGNYLISTKLKVIIYLKKHIDYRNPIAFEEKLASKLKKNFKLLTVSEKIPKERTGIPYFAGNKKC